MVGIGANGLESDADRMRYAASTSRITHIDGLRAVAVLLVILDHSVQRGLTSGDSGAFTMAIRRVFAEGAHGVDLFFVLSGFCLSYPILSQLARNGQASFDVAGYLARRLVRIIPPYYAAIALLVLVPLALLPLHVYVPAGVVNHAGAGDVLRQALFLDWRTSFINGSFWTLCVEFRWYFVFPVALMLWIKYPRLFALSMLGLVTCYWLTRLHSVDVGTLFPFLLGIVAAHAYVRHSWHRAAYYLVPAGILLGLLLENATSMENQFGADLSSPFAQINPGWQIAAFGLVLLAGHAKLLRAALSLRPIAAVGVASYSIYLVHEPVVQLVDLQMHGALLQCIVASIASIAAGALFWSVFERPWLYGSLRTLALKSLLPALTRGLHVLRVPRALFAFEADRAAEEAAA